MKNQSNHKRKKSLILSCEIRELIPNWNFLKFGYTQTPIKEDKEINPNLYSLKLYNDTEIKKGYKNRKIAKANTKNRFTYRYKAQTHIRRKTVNYQPLINQIDSDHLIENTKLTFNCPICQKGYTKIFKKRKMKFPTHTHIKEIINPYELRGLKKIKPIKHKIPLYLTKSQIYNVITYDINQYDRQWKIREYPNNNKPIINLKKSDHKQPISYNTLKPLTASIIALNQKHSKNKNKLWDKPQHNKPQIRSPIQPLKNTSYSLPLSEISDYSVLPQIEKMKTDQKLINPQIIKPKPKPQKNKPKPIKNKYQTKPKPQDPIKRINKKYLTQKKESKTKTQQTTKQINPLISCPICKKKFSKRFMKTHMIQKHTVNLNHKRKNKK